MFDNTSLSFVNPNLLSEIPSGSRSYDPDVSIVGKGAEDIQTVAKAPSRSLFHWSGLVVLCRLMSFGQPSESKRKARTLGWLVMMLQWLMSHLDLVAQRERDNNILLSTDKVNHLISIFLRTLLRRMVEILVTFNVHIS
ncbi:hypothetical protein V6N12_003089 [Hibiscus sabdariffa]|uniref:Uncharacterized protein n=1 Tax=Hibiscus sabdariffa TaxID=183260 RepID=A0ABR2EAX8_9ROSI